MELRNIRRVYMVNKGLRIWRKRNGFSGGSGLSRAGLNYLYCLYFNEGYYSAVYVRDLLRKDGHPSIAVASVVSMLDLLCGAGYVGCNEAGKYYLSVEGRKVLFEIEKYIRLARPDR